MGVGNVDANIWLVDADKSLIAIGSRVEHDGLGEPIGFDIADTSVRLEDTVNSLKLSDKSSKLKIGY